MCFFPSFFPPCHHLKCSLFMYDGRRLQGSTFPWRLAFVTMVAGQYWRPLYHPCTPVTQGWRGHSEHTDTLYWGEHESMDLQSVESMRVCWGGWVCTPLCVYVSGCVRVLGARPCLCVSSLSQPAESAVSLHLTAGQKLEQEMNSDSVSASHKFLFSYPTQKTTYLHCISPGTPFSFWWWFRDVEISLWTSELSQRETVRRR